MKNATTHKSPNKKYQARYVVCLLLVTVANGSRGLYFTSPIPYMYTAVTAQIAKKAREKMYAIIGRKTTRIFEVTN